MLDLPEPRRRPVVDAALRCSARGWVAKIPSQLASEDTAITALLGFCNPQGREPRTTSTTRTPRIGSTGL
jgi:hypothetical protein